MKDIMNEKNDGPYLIDNFRLLIVHILIEYLHLGSMRVKRKQARNGQNFSLVCCLWTLKPKEPIIVAILEYTFLYQVPNNFQKCRFPL